MVNYCWRKRQNLTLKPFFSAEYTCISSISTFQSLESRKAIGRDNTLLPLYGCWSHSSENSLLKHFLVTNSFALQQHLYRNKTRCRKGNTFYIQLEEFRMLRWTGQEKPGCHSVLHSDVNELYISTDEIQWLRPRNVNSLSDIPISFC
jgi:hypothetical protein